MQIAPMANTPRVKMSPPLMPRNRAIATAGIATRMRAARSAPSLGLPASPGAPWPAPWLLGRRGAACSAGARSARGLRQALIRRASSPPEAPPAL